MGYEEDSKSKFNAGVALAERLDALQTALNFSRMNIKAFNMETMTYNYQVMLDSLEGLKMECWPKLNPKEQEEIMRIGSVITKFLVHHKVIETVRLKNEEKMYWNESNLQKYKLLLQIYEKSIKKALDVHDLNSPNREDDDGL